MKIVLISGLSGSGKSVALKLLEDVGYYCIDNLPLSLLPDVVKYHISQNDVKKLSISIDIRSRINIEEALKQIQSLKSLGHEVDLLFIEAERNVLIRRFSETRRGHPLATQNLTLIESLDKEKKWLSPLREIAHCIDSSKLSPEQLRHNVRQWLELEKTGFLVILESFGFKYDIPTNIDFLFDVRSLPNPYHDHTLRPFTGLDSEIKKFLKEEPLANKLVDDIGNFLLSWLPHMQRNYVTIAIGCTGGQHRSVFVVEQLSKMLSNQYELLIRHRQLNN